MIVVQDDAFLDHAWRDAQKAPTHLFQCCRFVDVSACVQMMRPVGGFQRLVPRDVLVCGSYVAFVGRCKCGNTLLPAPAFHPKKQVIATAGADPRASGAEAYCRKRALACLAIASTF